MTLDLRATCSAIRRLERLPLTPAGPSAEFTDLLRELVSADPEHGALLAWAAFRERPEPEFARQLSFAAAVAEPNLNSIGVLLDVILSPKQGDPSTLLNTLTSLRSRLRSNKTEHLLAPGIAEFLTRCLRSHLSVREAALELTIEVLDSTVGLLNSLQAGLIRRELLRLRASEDSADLSEDLNNAISALEGMQGARWAVDSMPLRTLVGRLQNSLSSASPADARTLLRRASDALGCHLETIESALSAADANTPVQSLRLSRSSGKAVDLSSITSISEAWRELFVSASEAMGDAADLFGVAAVPGSFVLRAGVRDGDHSNIAFEQTCRLLVQAVSEEPHASLKESTGAIVPLGSLLESLGRDGVTLDLFQYDPASDYVTGRTRISPQGARRHLHEVRSVSTNRLESRDVPQADRLDRVFRLVELLESASEVTSETLDVVHRQVNYYFHAAKILGFVSDSHILTSAGLQVARLEAGDRLAATAVRFEGSLVGSAWIGWCQGRSLADIDPATAEPFLASSVRGLEASTASRRSATLRAWLAAVLPYHYKGNR